MAAGDLNKVVLMGRLTRDPDIRSTPQGVPVCHIRIANNRIILRGGKKETITGFFDCIAWGKQAEIISRYFSKGQRILIEGFLRFRQWQSPEGKSRTKVDIQVENFNFIEPREEIPTDVIEEVPPFSEDFPEDEEPPA